MRACACAAVLLAACGVEHSPAAGPPEPVDLAAGLAGAACGDVVVALPGDYDGPLTVPAGVRVVVEPPGSAVVRGSDGSAAVLEVRTGACGPAVVAGLGVVSQAGVAVRVTGDGEASFSDVGVEVLRGYGLVADGPARLSLSRVTLAAEMEDAGALRYPIDPSLFPVLGLVVAHVGAAELDEVAVRGFAGIAATLQCATVAWRGGGVEDAMGVGVLQVDGDVDLTDVAVERTVNCPHMTCAMSNQVIGYVLADGGRLTTTRVRLADNGGVGLLQDGATSGHDDLVVTGQATVGLWLQGGADDPAATAFSLEGDGSRLADNGGAGLLSEASGDVSVRGAYIGPARELEVPCGPVCRERVAYGLRLTDVAGVVALSDLEVAVEDGIGIHLGCDAACLDRVQVQDIRLQGGPGAGLCLPEGVERPEGWTTEEAPTLDPGRCEGTGTWGSGFMHAREPESETCRSDFGDLPGARLEVGVSGLLLDAGD